jgi:hypothetical protein
VDFAVAFVVELVAFRARKRKEEPKRSKSRERAAAKNAAAPNEEEVG